MTIEHIAADYKQIESMIVVDTQAADNVFDIETVNIVAVDILKSNRNEN